MPSIVAYAHIWIRRKDRAKNPEAATLPDSCLKKEPEMNGTTHVTPAGGNIFEDLGFDPVDAAALKADSHRIIKESLAVRKLLLVALSEWLKENDLRRTEAAEILGVSRPRIADLVSLEVSKFTIDALVSMLSRAGKKVSVQVQ